MGVVTEMVQSLIAEVSSTRKLVEAQQSQIHELRLQQTGMLNALQKATRTADVIEKFQTQFPQEMRDAITDASSGYSKLGGAMTEVSTTLARLCRLNSIDASQLYDYWETIPGTFEGIERFHADFKEAQLELQELAIPRVDEQGKRIVPDPELRVAAQARLKAATKALEEALILKEEAERRMQEAAQPTIEEVAAAVWLWNCHLYPDRTLTTSLDEQASLVLVDAARTAATYGAKSVAESLDEGRIMAALMTSMSWYFNDETFSQEQRTPSGLLASLLKYKIPIAGYLNGPKPKLWTRASVLEMVNKRLTKEHVPG